MAARKTSGTVIAGTDEGQQDTVAESPKLDFAAWLGLASRPQREVTLYAANGVQARIARLERERDEARGQITASTSWGDAGDVAPETPELDAAIADAQAELAASGLVFTVQSSDSDENDQIERDYPLPKDADEATRSDVFLKRLMARMAVQVIGPKTFTADELVQVRKAIGEPEFQKLLEVCSQVNAEVSASTPTWLGNSGGHRS